MGLFRLKEDLFDQARLRIRVWQQGAALPALSGLVDIGVMGLVPVHEIVGAVWVRMALGVPVDIGQHRCGNAMTLVGDQFTEGLQRVVRPPLGEFCAVDLRQQLADGLAQGQR